MATESFKSTTTTIRDSKSGRFVTVKGAGALKGKLTIDKKVDLTKPISVRSPGVRWVPNNAKAARESRLKDKR